MFLVAFCLSALGLHFVVSCGRARPCSKMRHGQQSGTVQNIASDTASLAMLCTDCALAHDACLSLSWT